MHESGRPLIVGAGPVGLAAGLFLARQGQLPRIVEMRDEPTTQSKALAVNPRTLDILAPTGVTERMLQIGLPIRGVRFHRGERNFATIEFAGIHPRYPFMLALSQATTERLLAEALAAVGGCVERGIQLVACRTAGHQVEATLEQTTGGARELVRCPWLLAADGAHSVVRHELGIEFQGTSFARDWYLADAPLRCQLAADHAHVFFLADGALLFLIRVIADATTGDGAEQLWRMVTNRPDPLSQLVDAEPAGPPVWESSFHVSHRINQTLARDGAYFAGDAAHVHSPIGARGMNLGIEDAWVFAELARANRLTMYDTLRRPVDRRVVRQVELVSRMVAADSPLLYFVRRAVFPLAIRIPMARSRIVKTVTGLDHELPRIAARETSHDADAESKSN